MLPQGIVQGLELFEGFSPEELRLLTAGAEHEAHKHKDIVFAAGEPAEQFGIVLQGCYKLSRGSGNETLLSFALRNDPVGLLMMPNPSAVYPVTMQSLGVSRVLRLPRSTYLDHWFRSPEILRRSQLSVMRRCLGFQADRELQHLSLEQRVAAYLLRCFDQYAGENTKTISFPLSRRDIADAVGAQVESVIRVMSQWEKAGLISTRAQFIEVLSPAGLVEAGHSRETVKNGH